MRRQSWLLAAGILLSAGLLALSLRGTSRAGLAEAVAALRWTSVPLFAACLFGFYWLKAVRWRVLLAPLTRTRAAALFPVVMIGYAANAILPAQIGEVVRAWLGARRLALPASASLASIVLERLFDFAMVLLALALAFATGRALPADLATAGRWTAMLLLAAVLGVLTLALFPSGVVRLVRRLLTLAPAAVAERASRQLANAASGLQALRRPRLLGAALLLSIVKWSCMLGCIAASVWAAGIDVSLATLLMLLALTVLGVSLPTAPGYVGTIQIAFTLALVPVGVDPNAAVAASLFYHVLAYVSVVLAGLAYLKREGLQIGQLRAIRAAGSQVSVEKSYSAVRETGPPPGR